MEIRDPGQKVLMTSVLKVSALMETLKLKDEVHFMGNTISTQTQGVQTAKPLDKGQQAQAPTKQPPVKGIDPVTVPVSTTAQDKFIPPTAKDAPKAPCAPAPQSQAQAPVKQDAPKAPAPQTQAQAPTKTQAQQTPVPAPTKTQAQQQAPAPAPTKTQAK